MLIRPNPAAVNSAWVQLPICYISHIRCRSPLTATSVALQQQFDALAANNLPRRHIGRLLTAPVVNNHFALILVFAVPVNLCFVLTVLPFSRTPPPPYLYRRNDFTITRAGSQTKHSLTALANSLISASFSIRSMWIGWILVRMQDLKRRLTDSNIASSSIAN